MWAVKSLSLAQKSIVSALTWRYHLSWSNRPWGIWGSGDVLLEQEAPAWITIGITLRNQWYDMIRYMNIYDLWFMIYMIYVLWYMIHDTWNMIHDTDTVMVWYGMDVWMYVYNCIYNYSDRVFPSKPRLSKPKGIHMSLLRPVLPPPSWPGPAAIVDLGVTNERWGGLSVALIINKYGNIFWTPALCCNCCSWANLNWNQVEVRQRSIFQFDIIYV